jgi:pimeloyl-ACP methyl ester carboxylesterase
MADIQIHEHQSLIASMGARTRVLEAGSGPVVLMLHGNPDNADEWRPLMGLLSNRYRCLAPDFPGYGKADLPPSFGYTLAEQVSFLDDVLHMLGAEGPITVVMHDIGGMVGTAWAAANIARLRGVVITNTVAFEGFHWFEIARTWAGDSLLQRWRAQFGMFVIGLCRGALFKKIFGRQSPELSEADLDRFAASFAVNATAKAASLRQFRVCVPPQFFAGFDAMWVKLSQTVPCRVIWGDGDPYISAQYAHRFGTAHVTIVPNGGHWMALTAPEKLAAEVEAVDGRQALVEQPTHPAHA